MARVRSGATALWGGRHRLAPPRYIRFAVHEAFHAFQIATLDGGLPDFGLSGSERDLLPELAEARIAAGVATEAQALAVNRTPDRTPSMLEPDTVREPDTVPAIGA